MNISLSFIKIPFTERMCLRFIKIPQNHRKKFKIIISPEGNFRGCKFDLIWIKNSIPHNEISNNNLKYHRPLQHRNYNTRAKLESFSFVYRDEGGESSRKIVGPPLMGSKLISRNWGYTRRTSARPPPPRCYPFYPNRNKISPCAAVSARASLLHNCSVGWPTPEISKRD